MECTFVVGQKVVCCMRLTCPTVPGRILPVKGQIYTIREVFMGSDGPTTKAVGVRLVEIVNQPANCYEGIVEPGFFANNFRPLTDTEKKVEKGISTLRGITKDTVIPEDGKQNTRTPERV